MNWCKPHWDQLREKLESKGLGDLGAKTGQQVISDLKASIEGKPTDFDPLMGCWLRINTKMLQSPALNGRILQCPLCILVEDGQPQVVDNWLNGVTTEALNEAVRLGLIPTPEANQGEEGKS